MSATELERVEVIGRVVGRRLSQVDAGALLGLTARQVRRLCRAFEATFISLEEMVVPAAATSFLASFWSMRWSERALATAAFRLETVMSPAAWAQLGHPAPQLKGRPEVRPVARTSRRH